MRRSLREAVRIPSCVQSSGVRCLALLYSKTEPNTPEVIQHASDFRRRSVSGDGSGGVYQTTAAMIPVKILRQFAAMMVHGRAVQNKVEDSIRTTREKKTQFYKYHFSKSGALYKEQKSGANDGLDY